jgi:type VI secretion system protein ImpG
VSFNKYYQDELSYLREMGQEFSREYPKLAPFLASAGLDPDVERLLEGFAFLSGRLRQKLDDELPELTHTLMNLLWPHYLRPLPAMSVVQFDPHLNVLSEGKQVARGVEVDSLPVDGTTCRFRTCYDVRVYPLRVDSVQQQRVPGGSTLRVVFTLDSGASFDQLGLDTLRLFLHGDPFASSSLYLWIFRYLKRAWVRAGAEREGAHAFDLPPGAIRPVGFEEEHGLLPYPKNAFLGYRLLQEYFTLPEKFLFVDVGGLERLAGAPMADRFELNLELSRPLPEQVRLKPNNLRLHCTPVINLFERDADPIRLDQRKVEYRVRPSGLNANHYEIYSIERVEGWLQGTGRKRQYHPFESFDHVAEEGGRPIFYRQRVRPAVVGRGVDTYVSFVTTGERFAMPGTETISLELVCSNRNLPEKLRPGDIGSPTGNSPEFADFQNITAVTPSLPPPLEAGLHWQLISNMALSYVSLTDLEALRVLLTSYDFRAFYDRQAERVQQLRMEGIADVEVATVDLLYRGLPVRGLRTRMGMRESKFAGEGDMYLFASVLNEFFALYASINSFHELSVRGMEGGEVYEWPPRIGQQPLL